MTRKTRRVRPYEAVVERNLALWQLNFRHQRHKRLDEIEEPYYVELLAVLLCAVIPRRHCAHTPRAAIER